MKLLLDEQLPPVVASDLRAAGHEALAVKERADLSGMSDSDLLEFATADGWVIVTADHGDFLALTAVAHQEGRPTARLVLIRSRELDRNRSAFTRRLLHALIAFLGDPPGGSSQLYWFI